MVDNAAKEEIVVSSDTKECTGNSKNGKSSTKRQPKLNADGTRRIIRKGVQRTLRKKTMEQLLKTVTEYKQRLQKHEKTCGRMQMIIDNYSNEIAWKEEEAKQDPVLQEATRSEAG